MKRSAVILAIVALAMGALWPAFSNAASIVSSNKEYDSGVEGYSGIHAIAYHCKTTTEVNNGLSQTGYGKPIIISDDGATASQQQVIDWSTLAANQWQHYEHLDDALVENWGGNAQYGAVINGSEDFPTESKNNLQTLGGKASYLAPYGTLTRVGGELRWNGSRVKLMGSSWYGALLGQNCDIDSYLNVLQSYGVNFTRVWVIDMWTALAMFNNWNNGIIPFPGSFGSYDLYKQNEAFYSRAASFVNAAWARGIVVQLTIFDRCGLQCGQDFRFNHSPYNAANNAQDFLTCGGGYPDFTGMDGTNIGSVNKSLAQRLVSDLSGKGNVIFEIMNEPLSSFSNLTTWHQWVADIVNNAYSAQSPYSGVISLPGTAQAENFDNGGQNIAYVDMSSGNAGGAYRSTDVDIQATGDTGGGYNVGWTDTGEWLEYTVNVANSGSYDIKARVASPGSDGSFHVDMNGQNVTGTKSVPNTGDWQVYTTVTASAVSLNAGQQTMRFYIDSGGFNINYIEVASVGQSPYAGVINLPGTAQAENFDNGGEGVAYHDGGSGNEGGAYRSTDVDIENTGDSGGGCNVGWIDTGEWLEYTVNVASSGNYDIRMRTAAPNDNCAVHIEMNGNNVTGTRSLPNTGGWQTYTTTTFSGISLNAGQQIMRVYIEGGGWNFNYIDVIAAGQSPYAGVINLPGTAQAENYDNGGEGVAYHDNTPGNTGGQYRNDDVDIEGCGDTGGGYDIGNIDNGDWTEYTVNVATTGTYDITARVASATTGGTFHIEFGGVNKTGTKTVPNTGDWQTYTDITASGVSLSAGQQVMRVVMDTGPFNLNYVHVATAGGGQVTISNSAFDSDANGWTITTWRAATQYAYGTMAWVSGSGNPGGGMRSTGTGGTDNNDRCNREGGEIYKVISTSGYSNISVKYDLKVNSLGNNQTGTGAGSCAVDHNIIDEQLTVFYSTNGGSSWTEAEYLTRSSLLASYQSYGTRTINLSGVSACNNNPNFALRFRWQFNTASDTGDLDNIKVLSN